MHLLTLLFYCTMVIQPMRGGLIADVAYPLRAMLGFHSNDADHWRDIGPVIPAKNAPVSHVNSHVIPQAQYIPYPVAVPAYPYSNQVIQIGK